MFRGYFALPLLIMTTAADLPPSYGPDPTWEGARRLGEEALRRGLIDPGSAQIEWPYNFVTGTLKSPLSKRRSGWYTCGFVNAKNRMGGYTGRAWFLIMINSGIVISLDIGTESEIDTASATCPGLAKKGHLPPAPIAPVATSALDAMSPQAFAASADKSAGAAAARGGVGIAFQATPFGALIAAVAPGSSAAKAGLKAGEVIETVNGISIKTFTAAEVSKLLTGAGDEIKLGIIGFGEIKVVRQIK